ncbi:hypothetical protein K440DRAFT_497098, partial [Wilcoxina mikolae CBS 423.85]
MERVNTDEFFKMTSAIDQENHKRTIRSGYCDQPDFYWIFKNMDFEQWYNSTQHEALWISGPRECHIDHASSHIVDLAKTNAAEAFQSVMFFFCSTAAADTNSIVAAFVHTLLQQFVHNMRPEYQKIFIRKFLQSIFHSILNRQRPFDRDSWWFEHVSSSSQSPMITKILDAASDSDYWDALTKVLPGKNVTELFIIIDGLHEVKHRQGFIAGLRTFISRLQRKVTRVKSLFTSRSRPDIEGILCIEYDVERREHEGSLQWLWTHEQYMQWSTSNDSSLLYIQGKPGSGKSTVAKFFKDNLPKQAPRNAIIASFFYSFREGEQEKSHYYMLRSILYDILYQDESFFYLFQMEYREYKAKCRERKGADLSKWHYNSLKKILLSLGNDPRDEHLYLIIDAVDESNETDRKAIFDLLFKLCSKEACTVKVFIASRPVLAFEVTANKFSSLSYHTIRMQDMNKRDIEYFVSSFLPDFDLPPDTVTEATKYIVEHADGVFLWVRLVESVLRGYAMTGCTKRRIYAVLGDLPNALEGLYGHILRDLGKGSHDDIRDGIKMFEFVLFACRPLKVPELQHALAIPNNPNEEFSSLIEYFTYNTVYGMKKRIIHCGRNLIETNVHDNSVQVMHPTVRDFFLQPGGPVANSRFRMLDDVQIRIFTTCIRYLILFCTSQVTSMGEVFQPVGSWTSEDFENYIWYLNERPFINYVLCHLKDHRLMCPPHESSHCSKLISQVLEELTIINPASYLLKSWVTSHLGRNLQHLCPRKAEDFRTEILWAAMKTGSSQVVEALMAAGSDVKTPLHGKPLLVACAEIGQTASVRLLLEHGVHVETAGFDDKGRAALHRASANGHLAMVELLLENGADIEGKESTNRGRTALHYAAANGQDATVRLLVDKGADISARESGNRGKTALHCAAANGHTAIVQLLHKKGADLNAREMNNRGRTALHYASNYGHYDTVRTLLEIGANIDAADGNGQTAL